MSEPIKITAGNVHRKTRKALADGYKVIIHKGGTGSGKTFDLTVFLLFSIAMVNAGWIITVVSE